MGPFILIYQEGPHGLTKRQRCSSTAPSHRLRGASPPVLPCPVSWALDTQALSAGPPAQPPTYTLACG